MWHCCCLHRCKDCKPIGQLKQFLLGQLVPEQDTGRHLLYTDQRSCCYSNMGTLGLPPQNADTQPIWTWTGAPQHVPQMSTSFSSRRVTFWSLGESLVSITSSSFQLLLPHCVCAHPKLHRSLYRLSPLSQYSHVSAVYDSSLSAILPALASITISARVWWSHLLRHIDDKHEGSTSLV